MLCQLTELVQIRQIQVKEGDPGIQCIPIVSTGSSGSLLYPGSEDSSQILVFRARWWSRRFSGYEEYKSDLMRIEMILWRNTWYYENVENMSRIQRILETGDCVFFSVKVMERDILKHSNWNLDSSFCTISLGQFHCTHQIDIRKHEKSKIKQTISLLFWTEMYHIR